MCLFKEFLNFCWTRRIVFAIDNFFNKSIYCLQSTIYEDKTPVYKFTIIFNKNSLIYNCLQLCRYRNCCLIHSLWNTLLLSYTSAAAVLCAEVLFRDYCAWPWQLITAAGDQLWMFQTKPEYRAYRPSEVKNKNAK